jgi:hypothetical protein
MSNFEKEVRRLIKVYLRKMKREALRNGDDKILLTGLQGELLAGVFESFVMDGDCTGSGGLFHYGMPVVLVDEKNKVPYHGYVS